MPSGTPRTQKRATVTNRTPEQRRQSPPCHTAVPPSWSESAFAEHSPYHKQALTSTPEVCSTRPHALEHPFRHHLARSGTTWPVLALKSTFMLIPAQNTESSLQQTPETLRPLGHQSPHWERPGTAQSLRHPPGSTPAAAAVGSAITAFTPSSLPRSATGCKVVPDRARSCRYDVQAWGRLLPRRGDARAAPALSSGPSRPYAIRLSLPLSDTVTV